MDRNGLCQVAGHTRPGEWTIDECERHVRRLERGGGVGQWLLSVKTDHRLQGQPVTTDKIAGGYLPVYQAIARDLGPAARVCELGVDRGESLAFWRGLFPDGDITGVDHHPYHGATHGCRVILMDQADPELPAALGGMFDLIVDDCSHKGHLTGASFTLLWPLLRPGGFYVVEDWMIGLPEFRWHWMHDPVILDVVASFLRLLATPDSEAEEVTYRYGLAIVKRRR
jgi:Methyltransferase domain